MSIDFAWIEEKVLLRKLNADECALLDSLIEISEHKAGEVIVAQGEPGGVLYLVRSGTADIECDANGAKIRVGTAGERSMFGEMTFLTCDKATATVTARENCTVYSLTRNEFSELMVKDQDMVYEIFAHMLINAASIIRHMNEEHVAMLQYITGRRL